MTFTPLSIVVLVVSIAVTASVSGHEFWIQPDRFRTRVDASVDLRLYVGDGFPGEHKPRDAKKLERLDVIGPDADSNPVAVEGKDGADPVGSFTPVKPGVYVVSYRGRESTLTLEAEKFENYLREEGLEEVIKKRSELNESMTPGREAYSRCAKSLLCAGNSTDGAWNVKSGLTVEIVPASNPYAAHAGDTVGFVLLRDGKPVANAQLTGLSQVAGKTVRATARTDAAGKASFTLKQSGLWVINAVLMDRVDAKAGRADVDWVSIWSSLSFDIAGANQVEPAAPDSKR